MDPIRHIAPSRRSRSPDSVEIDQAQAVSFRQDLVHIVIIREVGAKSLMSPAWDMRCHKPDLTVNVVVNGQLDHRLGILF